MSNSKKPNLRIVDDLGNTLNKPEAIRTRKELIESMRKAEEAVKATLCGLNVIASVSVDASGKDPRYVGLITMQGQDGKLYGQTLEGPLIKEPRRWGPDAIDSRRELAEMLRELANGLYENIEEHP